MGRTGYCRDHILDAGTGVLVCKGYNGTGVKEIVDAAGVPKGSFYNHFESKEAFVVEALEKLARDNLNYIESNLFDSKYTAKSNLLRFFDEGQKEYELNGFSHGCLFGNLCLEMADENEAIRNATSQVMGKIIALISKCLAQSQQEGDLSKSQNTDDLAEFIFYAWEGATMRMKGQRNERPYRVFREQLLKYFN